MRLTRIAVVLVFAAGCTPLQWVKPDTLAEQAEEDLSFCRQEAWREARLHGSWFHRPIFPHAVQDAQGRRFMVWPQSGFYDSFSDQFMEESRLAHFCMRSKGYQLVPVEKEKEATKR
jgi:hypothetical protein